MTHINHAVAPPIPHFPSPNTWDIAQMELNAYVQQQADELAPEIEVDSLFSGEEPTYRVWFGSRSGLSKYCFKLGSLPKQNPPLHSFWKSPVTGNWISEAFSRKSKKRFHSPQEAQRAIISARNLN